MSRKEKRNKKIKEEIQELRDLGWKVKDAIKIVADKYFLSDKTVKDIWYSKQYIVANKIFQFIKKNNYIKIKLYLTIKI